MLFPRHPFAFVIVIVIVFAIVIVIVIIVVIVIVLAITELRCVEFLTFAQVAAAVLYAAPGAGWQRNLAVGANPVFELERPALLLLRLALGALGLNPLLRVSMHIQ